MGGLVDRPNWADSSGIFGDIALDRGASDHVSIGKEMPSIDTWEPREGFAWEVRTVRIAVHT